MTNSQELQISQYFDHAMNSAEEQNFLITLAASDTMRIAFRSQLELMKAVRSDADRLRSVAAGRTAAVRDRTLTALGLSATAVTPFIEQELMGSSHDASTNTIPSAPHRAGFLAKPKYALGTGLFLGFLSAVAVLNIAGPGHQAALTPAVRVQQPVVAPANVSQSAANETIPASADLHKVADERSSAAVTGHAHHATHHTMQTAVKTSETSSPSANSVLPEVTTTNPGKVNVKTRINKPADDRSPAEHSTKAP
jgi:hypothetical protein